jgi:V-type H+-transporting ATPase subunit a
MYPFLFGVMFGDVGHSFIFLLVAVAMIAVAPKLSHKLSGIGKTVFQFRYFLLMMAICGMYNGIVYNEWFGLPIDIFRTHWAANGTRWARVDQDVYPLGVDPAWAFKDNELIFSNSMKMKIAVVMGVAQMMFGMVLQLIKQIHRRDWIELFFAWVPQMMYLGSFFVYMVAIIFLKWSQDQSGISDGVNLIQTLINLVLQPGKVTEGQILYEGQGLAQLIILIVFVGSIPIMLFVKPIVVWAFHGAENGVIELFVITLIEVMEFALSALSHTASYLRLWALSLAHSQLSRVLYEELFILTANVGQPALMFIGFAGWAGGTVALLLGMECFSALLHGIRLMWVEFSSKFYSGMGYEFIPLSFRRAMAEQLEAE